MARRHLFGARDPLRPLDRHRPDRPRGRARRRHAGSRAKPKQGGAAFARRSDLDRLVAVLLGIGPHGPGGDHHALFRRTGDRRCSVGPGAEGKGEPGPMGGGGFGFLWCRPGGWSDGRPSLRPRRGGPDGSGMLGHQHHPGALDWAHRLHPGADAVEQCHLRAGFSACRSCGSGRSLLSPISV